VVGDGIALRHGRAVDVDDPEHGCDWRLGEHRATDRHVSVADIRRSRRTVDPRRICNKLIINETRLLAALALNSY